MEQRTTRLKVRSPRSWEERQLRLAALRHRQRLQVEHDLRRLAVLR